MFSSCALDGFGNQQHDDDQRSDRLDHPDDGADDERLAAGLPDGRHGDLHSQPDQAEREEPRNEIAEHCYLGRRVPDHTVRLRQHGGAFLRQGLRVDYPAHHGVVVLGHDLLVLDEPRESGLLVVALDPLELLPQSRDLLGLEVVVDLLARAILLHQRLLAVVEIGPLVMARRGEDAGRGQQEHQDEPEHEYRELVDDDLHGVDFLDLALRRLLAPDIPDRQPDHDDRKEQHAGDIEYLGNLQRFDAAGLECERGAGDLRGIEDAGAGPGAKLYVTHAERLAHDREQEHAQDAEKQDGAYGVGDFERFRLHHRGGRHRGGYAAHADAGGQDAGHRVGQIAPHADYQHEPDRAENKEANEQHRELPELCKLGKTVEGAQQYDAGLEAQPGQANAVLGPVGHPEDVDHDDAGEDAHHYIVQVHHAGKIESERGLRSASPVRHQRVEAPFDDERDQHDEHDACDGGEIIIGVSLARSRDEVPQARGNRDAAESIAERDHFTGIAARVEKLDDRRQVAGLDQIGVAHHDDADDQRPERSLRVNHKLPSLVVSSLSIRCAASRARDYSRLTGSLLPVTTR